MGEVRKRTFESSIDALRTVYYVVIGLAITEALNRTFTRNGSFVGREIFDLGKILLIISFMLTACRFAHGASIHLGKFSEKRHKPVVDFLGFLTQASLFYVMAIALNKPKWFMFSFILMLSVDAIWLLFLMIGKIIDITSTERQWLRSDGVMLIFFLCIFLVDKTVSSVFSLISICVIAVLATIFDYLKNWAFYFPEFQSHVA